DARREFNEAQHAKRLKSGTPLHQGNKPGSNVVRRPKRKPGERYTVGSYDHAIIRACEKAFGMPTEYREPVGEAKEAELKRPLEQQQERRKQREANRAKWREQFTWHPNQLRHNAATEIRRRYGIEVAQTILGHKLGSGITEIYAEANVKKAKGIMAK